MSFEQVTRHIPVCDSCGPGWWEADRDLDGPPHFVNPDTDATRNALANAHGWTILQRPDGTYHMVCHECATASLTGRAECELLGGHDRYVPEADPNTEQQAKWEQDHPFPIVLCRRCDRVLRDDAPAAGHPDAMDHRLPADLAELDRLTWPQGSEVNGRVVSLDPIDDCTYRGDDT